MSATLAAQAFISVFGGWVASDERGHSIFHDLWGMENWELTFLIGSFAALLGVVQVQLIVAALLGCVNDFKAKRSRAST